MNIVTSLNDLIGLEVKSFDLPALKGKTIYLRELNGSDREYFFRVVNMTNEKDRPKSLDAYFVTRTLCDKDGKLLCAQTSAEVDKLATESSGNLLSDICDQIMIMNGFKKEAVENEKKPSNETPSDLPGTALPPS